MKTQSGADIYDDTAYFLRWYNGETVLTTKLAAVPETAVMKVNPVLIEKGIISATDTMQAAYTKWIAYVLKSSAITFTGDWSMGNFNHANGLYEVISNHSYLNYKTVFQLRDNGTKLDTEYDKSYLVQASTVNRQYLGSGRNDSMYEYFAQLIPNNTVVTDIALDYATVYPKRDNKVYASYNNGALFLVGEGNKIFMQPGATKNGMRDSALVYTVKDLGFATIKVDAVTLGKDSGQYTDFAVLCNGVKVMDYVTIDITANDAVDKFNAALADLEIGVYPGDKIALVFSRSNGNPYLAVDATVEVDTNRKPPEVWSGSASNATENIVKDGTEFFFQWYEGGVKLAVGATISETAACKVNPLLIEKGIIAADDTVREAFNKWTAYLKENSELTYNGAWEIDNYAAGKLAPLAYYDYYNNRSPFCVNNGKVIGVEDGYWVVETGFDRVMNGLWNCMARSMKGNEIVSEVALPLAGLYTSVVSPAAYETGGMMKPGYTLYTGSDPKGGRELAYTWTSHAAGVALFDVQSISGNGSLQFNVLLNGRELLPNYVQIDLSAADAAAKINEVIAGLEIPVFKGDKVSIVFARIANVSKTVKAVIKGGLDDSRFPVVYKKNGVILQQSIANLGDPVPALSNAPDYGLLGYRVNDVYCKTLPETVTEFMVIEDYQIKTAANITITSKYAINVFVEGGEGVIGAGVILNNEMIEGEKQADGTYKVVVTSVNANALRNASVTYTPYQIDEEGYRVDRFEKTVSAFDLLNAYVEGDYDKTTKDLAQGVLDFSVALNAFLTNVDASADVKLRLRGEETIPGVPLSGKNEIYLGTLKYISTGEVPKYISNNQDKVFVADPTVTEEDKVKIGYAEGVNPLSSEYKYAIKAVTLNLEEKIGFAFRVIANGRNTVSDLREGGVYKLRSFDGKRYAYYDAFLYEGADKSAKAIVVDGVPASRYYQDFEFDIVELQEDGTYKAVSATMTYSVKAYSVQTYRFGDWGYKPMLAQALFRLCVHAQAYAEAHPVA